MKFVSMMCMVLFLVMALPVATAGARSFEEPVFPLDGQKNLLRDRNPYSTIISRPAKGMWLSSLIPIRNHFLPEMLASMDDFASF